MENFSLPHHAKEWQLSPFFLFEWQRYFIINYSIFGKKKFFS